MSWSLRMFFVFRDGLLFNHFENGIVFLPGNKIYTVIGQPGEHTVIRIPPVYDNNGTRGKREFPRNPHFMDIPFGDVGEDGEVSVMVQKKVELDCAFGLSICCPVEEGKTEINHRCVEAIEFVFEPEFLFSLCQWCTCAQELRERLLIELPRSMFICIGQGGTTGGIFYPSMLYLSETGCQSSTDFP